MNEVFLDINDTRLEIVYNLSGSGAYYGHQNNPNNDPYEVEIEQILIEGNDITNVFDFNLITEDVETIIIEKHFEI